jgi:hypothetical protein
MNTHPKVLLIAEDGQGALSPCCRGNSNLDVSVEHSAEQAINRLGFEDFDLVVLDAQMDPPDITSSIIDAFRRMHVPFMLMGKRVPGANGYPVLDRKDMDKFETKICGLLGLTCV